MQPAPAAVRLTRDLLDRVPLPCGIKSQGFNPDYSTVVLVLVSPKPMALIRLPPVLDLVRDPFSMTVQRDSEPCRLADPQLFRTPASIFGWELGRCLAVSLLSQGSYGKYRIWFFDAAEETSDKCVDHANQAIYVNATVGACPSFDST